MSAVTRLIDAAKSDTLYCLVSLSPFHRHKGPTMASAPGRIYNDSGIEVIIQIARVIPGANQFHQFFDIGDRSSILQINEGSRVFIGCDPPDARRVR